MAGWHSTAWAAGVGFDGHDECRVTGLDRTVTAAFPNVSYYEISLTLWRSLGLVWCVHSSNTLHNAISHTSLSVSDPRII